MINPDTLFGRMGNRLFQMAYLYAQMKEGITPDIYLQDCKYFDKYRDEIKKWFGEGIGYLPYVSIHLRVGGNPVNPTELRYMDNPFYYRLVESGYYIDAVSMFPNRKFIVFSDDIEFARKYFEGDKFSFDESPTDLEAFNKMASCDGHIIANSSFSWWAAYLSPNEGKTVAPKDNRWFTDVVHTIGCPQEWTRI